MAHKVKNHDPVDRNARGLRRERERWSSALDHQIEALKGEKDLDAHGWATAVSRWVIDASLLADVDSLQAGLQALRNAYMRLPAVEQAGHLKNVLMVLAEVVSAGLDRARQTRLEEKLDPRSIAAKLLIAIHESPDAANDQLARKVEVDPTEISRSGGILLTRGLAVVARQGRVNAWRTTPRGAVTVQRLLDRATQAKDRVTTCEVCGNDYDMCFEVHAQGVVHVFDSFQCAIHALAPICEHCGTKMLEKGVEVGGHVYCCAHCAREEGATGVVDRVHVEVRSAR